jgi:hypothetical protein
MDLHLTVMPLITNHQIDIILFVSGVLFGWLINHIYASRANRDQRNLYNKLSAEIRGYILADPRDLLTVLELNKLLDEKTIDRSTRDPLPYKACPKCGSRNLLRGMIERHDDNFYVIECRDCPWNDWSQ